VHGSAFGSARISNARFAPYTARISKTGRISRDRETERERERERGGGRGEQGRQDTDRGAKRKERSEEDRTRDRTLESFEPWPDRIELYKS